MNDTERKQKALDILTEMGLKDLVYLGLGNEGIAFHDKRYVYKVLIPFYLGNEKDKTLCRLSYFKNISNCKHIYRLDDILEYKEFIIEKYQYEQSIPCTEITEKEAISFLTECWQHKVIIQDCKLKNFIRVNNIIKLVDLAGCDYSDNMFINMCIRMFLYVNYYNQMDKGLFIKLQRSVINNFDFSELQGSLEFVNKVFANIIYEESKDYIDTLRFNKQDTLSYEEYSFDKLPNLQKLFYLKLRQGLYLSDIQVEEVVLSQQNTFVPNKIHIGYKKVEPLKEKVSLLIKTCAMDVLTIEQNIRHIVRQLCCPHTFYEIVVSVDSKKEQFLRQYTIESNYDKLITILKSLQEEKVIDRYICFEDDLASKINYDWFDLVTDKTHSSTNVPVSSQLYAFEQCNGDYVLQMDSDVMIGRKDYNHDYVADMIGELNKNEKVLSVGFNICNSESKSYFGFENGGFVPEVRMCLFKKDRLMSVRPLPNDLDSEGRLILTWYRSLEKHQKSIGYCSIRGGDNRTFFVHPQNYRKTKQYSWLNILDRVEQTQIPSLQLDHFDCEGSFYDWGYPKRREEVIIFSCFHNVTIDRFLRFWYSVVSQDCQNFGILLYDNCSDNGLSLLIEKLILPYRDRVTYIKGRNIMPLLQCEYIALHNYCDNPNSVIIDLDANNAVVGKNVFSLLSQIHQCGMTDITCGVSFRSDKVLSSYREKVDFINPRTLSSNVWKGPISFRKYLFDSIPIDHLMYENKELKFSDRKWYDSCENVAKMIPMIEMSLSPYQMDYINYYVDVSADETKPETAMFSEIKKKITLSPRDVVKGRKSFVTNPNRLDIDIIYKCNLKCQGCIRSCGQAPSEEKMTIESICMFVEESILHDKKWERINVLGGEPTLHPDFLKIIEILQTRYADIYNPDVVIQVVSNGLTEESRELCKQAEKYQNVKIDRNSFKLKYTNNIIDFFTPFNDAPCDDNYFVDVDYSTACWVAADSGFGLNINGYFACPNCGGIERVIKLGLGVKTFSDLTEEKMKEHFNNYCKYCGFFKHYASNKGQFISRNERAPFCDFISKSWVDIYKKYNGSNRE